MNTTKYTDDREVVYTLCSHTDTRWDKYGDQYCDDCYHPLEWRPSMVKAGVFSENTAAWVKGQADRLGVDYDIPTCTYCVEDGNIYCECEGDQ